MKPESIADEPPAPQVVRQAIQWMLKLRKHEDDPRLQAQCARWRMAHHQHELAWQRISELEQEFDLRDIPGSSAALRVLDGGSRRLRRRQALKLLGGTLLLGSAAWLGKDLQVLDAWTSDYASATGERRRFVLPDGAVLQLNTRSAAQLTYTGRQRVIRLRRGEMMLDCRTTSDELQPLLVASHDALLQGFAGRFVVRQEQDCTQVTVLEGQMAARRGSDQPLLWWSPGQSWRLDARGAYRLERLDMDAAAWIEGLIVTRDMRLEDFLAQVSRYRHGYLGCSQDIADLRLSGVYRLEDTDALLAVLPRTLPVQISYRTRWWVRVERSA